MRAGYWPWSYGIPGTLISLLYLVAIIWAFLDLARQSISPLAKVVWVLAILVFPLFGLIAYVLVGRRGGPRV